MPVEQTVIGRDKELAAIAEFLDDAARQPALIDIRGPAGIGKSTVWRAGLEMAAARGFQVLSTRPSEAESTLAFAGLIDVLDPVADRLLPNLPAIPSAALSAALRRSPVAVASADPVSVAIGVLGCLRLLAGERPLLVAVDDLQWLDAPSARVLEYAIRRLETEPVWFLNALRRGHANPLKVSDNVAPDLEVGPIGLESLERLLRARLGVAFLRPTMVRVERASGGNPLIAIELGRALLRRGIRFAPEELPIPEDIGELLRERLGGLTAGAQDVVLAAAILADPSVDVVGRMIGGQTDLMRVLEEAVRHSVLEIDGRAITFSHPLFSSVATLMVDDARLRAMHRVAAKIAIDPEERARHFAHASDRRSERVAHALEIASIAARQRGAPETAAELARMSYRRTPRRRPNDEMRRGIAVGHHLIAAGDLEAARGFLTGLLADDLSGPQRAAVLVGLAAAYRGHDQDIRRRLAHEATVVAGASLERADAEAALADIEWESLGDVRAGLRHARTALRLAEQHGDPARMISGLSQLAYLESIASGIVRHDLVARSRALEPQQRTSPDDFMVLSTRGLMLGWAGDLDGSRSWFEEAHAHVRRTGNWIGLPLVLRELAVLALRAGHWVRAIELAREAESASQEVGSRMARGIALVGVTQVLAYAGDAEAARRKADAAMPLLEAVGSQLNISRVQQLIGFLELSLGNYDAAHRVIGPAVADRLRAGVRNPGLLHGIPDDVEALVALGRMDDADATLRPFEGAAKRLDHGWALATGKRGRSLILAALGRTADALAVLNEALSIHIRVPEPFERGRTLLVRGEVERRARQRGEATRSLREALQIFEALGAQLWAARARDGLDRVDRTRTQAGLSETDRRVIALVSAGRTNREVAAELFMSPHTVDTHLRRIYRTVGVRGRAELAGRFRPT